MQHNEEIIGIVKMFSPSWEIFHGVHFSAVKNGGGKKEKKRNYACFGFK